MYRPYIYGVRHSVHVSPWPGLASPQPGFVLLTGVVSKSVPPRLMPPHVTIVVLITPHQRLELGYGYGLLIVGYG